MAVVDHVLRTERLVLRPVTADDHAALLAHWAASDVRRFLFDGAMLPAAEIAEAIEDSARDFARAGYGLWLVHENGRSDLDLPWERTDRALDLAEEAGSTPILAVAGAG